MDFGLMLSAILSYFTSNCFTSNDCEFGLQPPYLYVQPRHQPRRLLPSYHSNVRGRSADPDPPRRSDSSDDTIVNTNLGAVQGFKMRISESREIFAFTGIPFGEEPGRFMDPEPKLPWEGVWQATSPSPFCVQLYPAALGVKGQEDCLYLDVYSPRLPEIYSSDFDNSSLPLLLPVLIWLPCGSNYVGWSSLWGPARLLREEDVILVPINTRVGAYGFLSTGDEASYGNWALKDQSLAIEWVHSNIKAFGGDPSKITLGGVSSGGMNAHLMLFSNHETRNYVSKIFAQSGACFAKGCLDDFGRNVEASNIVARKLGCPTTTTTAGGDRLQSHRMINCLRKVDPYTLAARLIGFNMWSAVLEPPHPSAFITQLPEEQYKEGKVPPIPIIFSRTEREAAIQIELSRRAFNWPVIYRPRVSQLLRLGYRNGLPKPSANQTLQNLRAVNSFYFNENNVLPPLILSDDNIRRLSDIIDDIMFFCSMWKSVELHHKLAPTYVYIYYHNTFSFAWDQVGDTWRGSGATHLADMSMLFNNSKLVPPLVPGSKPDKVSTRLVNFIANFMTHGTPYFRTKEGKLIQPWKPVTNMENHPIALEVGLVNSIKMIRDPWVGSDRHQFWQNITF